MKSADHQSAQEQKMTYAALRSSRENATADDAVTGYDYYHQAWVVDSRYIACNHGKPCDCYGTKHEGERLAKNADVH
jgi:hypothetical protein